MFEPVTKFINHWYFRYLLVTELYMVEKWERIMIHIVFFIMLSGLFLFNTYVTLGLTSSLVDKLSTLDMRIHNLLQMSSIYGNPNSIINSEL